MSLRDRPKKSARKGYSWAACAGDFAILKDFLAEREKPLWVVFQFLDAFLRGFGQVVFANNPISGLLIAVALAATAPGTLISASVTAFLGLLLSVLTRDSQGNIENGLTVYNPLLVGAVSYALVPKTYGAFDAFSVLLVLLGTIFSVYLARSLENHRSPCLVWPFILAEYALLVVLATEEDGTEARAITRMDNATSDATRNDVSFIGENTTSVCIDWGMVFQGIVLSTSQPYAVESVAAGSVIYLALLIFSPTTAGFAFLGALFGSLAGFVLGVEPGEVYSGFWGFNSLLTGASLGGNLLVLNGQTVGATLVAIVYTVVLQYTVFFFLNKVKLPVLTLPFCVAASLFVKLGNNSADAAFRRPASASFPEKQRHDYLASRRAVHRQIDDTEDVGDDLQSEKAVSTMFNV